MTTSVRTVTGWSRRLSYLLRHHPESVGLTLSTDGWVPVDVLVDTVPGLTVELLTAVLDADDKSRFAVDGNRIRAVHGHSAGVADAAHATPHRPPPVLFHGTRRSALPSIETHGLTAQQRRYVHLSQTVEAAHEVGRRRDPDPLILAIDAERAFADGIGFYASGNGIWLTDQLPWRYCTAHP